MKLTLSESLMRAVNEANISQLKDMENILQPYYNMEIFSDMSKHYIKTTFQNDFLWADKNLSFSGASWFLSLSLFRFLKSSFMSLYSIPHLKKKSPIKYALYFLKAINKIVKRFNISPAEVYSNFLHPSDMDIRTLEDEAIYAFIYNVINAYDRILTEGMPYNVREYVLGRLQHYVNIGKINNIEGIYKYPFEGKLPSIVFAEMQEIVEDAIGENFQYYLPEDVEIAEYQNHWHEYMVFPDGWKWVKKDTNGCTFESQYGGKGHCGTDDSSRYLLSLREPVKSSSNLYKIRATFSVSDEGYLLQRKGTTWRYNKKGTPRDAIGNQKPEEDTYSYIVDLLKYGKERGDINGFGLSGYNAENDFSWDDLKDSDKDKLQEMGFKSLKLNSVKQLVQEGRLDSNLMGFFIGGSIADN